LPFKEGKEEIVSFISLSLLHGEFSLIAEAIEDKELLILYNLEELTSRDKDVLETLGDAAVSRGLVSQEDFSNKIEEWYRKYSEIEYEVEDYA
jgi:hypothetical protein